MSIYKELFLASVGLVGVSAKGAKRLAEAIAKRIPRKEAKKIFAALVAEGEKGARTSAREAKLLLKKVMKELDVPTRDEFASLKKKVEAIKK